MLTKEDLLQFGELLDSRLRPIDKRLENLEKNMITKSYIETNNRVLGTIFKVELASSIQEIIKAMKAGFQEIVKKIAKLDKTAEDHEDRIVTLEHEIFHEPQQ
jgi:uncharacterized coiled-coil DUF342 family protein